MGPSSVSDFGSTDTAIITGGKVLIYLSHVPSMHQWPKKHYTCFKCHIKSRIRPVTMKTTQIVALATTTIGVVFAQQPGIRRTDLQRHDINVPGHETIQDRVDFEAGASFPRHTHPGEEVIYVLEGMLEYTIDGEQPVILSAGDVFFVPAGVVHSVKNVGNCTGSELGTYIVQKGEPLVTLVEGHSQ